MPSRRHGQHTRPRHQPWAGKYDGIIKLIENKLDLEEEMLQEDAE